MLLGVLFTSIVLALIVGISSMMLTTNTKSLEQAYKDEATVLKLKADLIVVSDELTTNARAYVNTEDEAFYNAYMTEINDTKSYNRILEQMETILPSDLLALIQQTQQESATLAQQEMAAFEALQTGDKARAIDLVYNASYFEAKAVINGLLNTFDTALDTWIADEVAAVQAKGQTSLFMQLGAVLLLFAFVMAAIFVVLRKVKPLETLTIAAEDRKRGFKYIATKRF